MKIPKKKMNAVSSNEKKQISWIDGAKAIAIIAVIVNHLDGILYSGKGVVLTYYSVSLFIFLSGITSYISDEQKNESWWQTFIRSSKKIFSQYLIATFVVLIVKEHSFDFELYLHHVRNFDISPPYYFVLLYLQLMLCNRVIYNVLTWSTRHERLKDCIVFLLMAIVALLSVRRSSIFNAFGGAGMLFGGTYLVLYYTGMLIQKYDILNTTEAPSGKRRVVLIGVVLCLGIFAWRQSYTQEGILRLWSGINPPGILIMCYALSVLLLCQALFSGSRNKLYGGVVRMLCYVGNHSLWIFLYHKLILAYALEKYMFWIPVLVKWVLYIPVMITGSIFIEKIIKFCTQFVKMRAEDAV